MSFKSLIEGKKVLLLGPAKHIIEPKNTQDYLDFDVVVKLNKMVEKVSFLDNGLNYKNDVLYHCLDINIPNGDLPYSIDEWKKRRVKHLRITHPPITNYYHNNITRFNKLNQKYKICNSLVSANHFFELQNKCDTSPNTGTIAIYDLTKQNPKELHIRGITFNKTKYTNDYKEKIFFERKTKSQHNADKQLNFFINFYKENSSVLFLDQELKSILE